MHKSFLRDNKVRTHLLIAIVDVTNIALSGVGKDSNSKEWLETRFHLGLGM